MAVLSNAVSVFNDNDQNQKLKSFGSSDICDECSNAIPYNDRCPLCLTILTFACHLFIDLACSVLCKDNSINDNLSIFLLFS